MLLTLEVALPLVGSKLVSWTCFEAYIRVDKYTVLIHTNKETPKLYMQRVSVSLQTCIRLKHAEKYKP